MDANKNFSNFLLINFLLKGPENKVIKKVAFFYLIIFFTLILTNFIDGSLIILDDKKSFGLLQDYANYFYFLSFFITTCLFKKLELKFVRTFLSDYSLIIDETRRSSGFELKNCIDFDENYKTEYETLVKKQMNLIFLKEKIYKRIFYLIQLTILIVFLMTSVYLPLFTNQVTGNWNFSLSIYPLGFISNQIKDFFFWVIIVPPILWGVTTITLSITKICKEIDKKGKFNIRPLSPDRSGGLKQLGGLTLILFYMVIIQFSHLFATSLIIGFPISHQIIYPLFFTFTAFIFFFPILSVRKAMKLAKQEELERIMSLFDTSYLKFKEHFKNFDSIDSTQINQILEIKELYKQAESMPVWPFDVDTFLKFVSIFLIPLLVFVIQLLVNADSIIYNFDKLKIFESFK